MKVNEPDSPPKKPLTRPEIFGLSMTLFLKIRTHILNHIPSLASDLNSVDKMKASVVEAFKHYI